MLRRGAGGSIRCPTRMAEWLNQVMSVPGLSYLALFTILVISGFGLPLPEDVPLLAAGYACYLGYGRIEIMIPVGLFSVMGSDLMVYGLGRRYGHHVPRLPILRRYLTAERLAAAQSAFHEHGGKTLFMARFMPGLRTPVFFSAGVFKIPWWKMVVFDGGAALISVPTLVLLGYFFGARMDDLKKWLGRVEAVVMVAVVLVVAWLAWRWRKRRRARRRTSGADPGA